MKWTQENKEKLHYGIATAAFFIGIILCLIDFAVYPPLGEIHDTSLWFCGQMTAFLGAVFGISLHYESQLSNFKQEIRKNISDGK